MNQVSPDFVWWAQAIVYSVCGSFAGGVVGIVGLFIKIAVFSNAFLEHQKQCEERWKTHFMMHDIEYGGYQKQKDDR